MVEKGTAVPAPSTYGSCRTESQLRWASAGRLKPGIAATVVVLATVTVLAIVSFRASGMQAHRVSLLGMPVSLSPVSTVQQPRFQSLVGFNKQSDFPFAKTADGELPEEEPLATNQLGMSDATSPEDLPKDAVKTRPLPQLNDVMKVANSKASQQLAPLTEQEEPKAEDSPIGLAAAAKILKDSEMLGKSQGSDAWDSWKAAVKDAGPSIKDAITDDVTSFNPFPRQSLSEKMEVQDVWDHAQALAKPAGSLDGDAEETKDTVQNAEAQANAAAYLAANEAAATDAYDVSIPNPDMMAKGSSKSMAHQALAAKPRAVPVLAVHKVASQTLAAKPRDDSAMVGQAKAAPTQHVTPPRARQALGSRVQALAELSKEDIAGAEQRALMDATRARRSIQQSELKIAEQKGAEREAKRLAAALEQRYGVSADHTRAVRNERAKTDMRSALLEAKAARAVAHEVRGEHDAEEEHAAAAQARRLQKLLKEEELLRERKKLLRQQQSLRQQQLEADGEDAAAGGEEQAEAREEPEGEEPKGEATVFDLSRGHVDQRVHKNDNFLSDMLGMALGDEKRPMGDIVHDVHGASEPPLNMKHKAVTYNNGINGGQDPLEYLGSFDSRTAAEIYKDHKAPHEWPPHWSRGIFAKQTEESEEGDGENMDGVEGETAEE